MNSKYGISDLLDAFEIRKCGKGTGKNRYYYCPFHDDKKASFTVSKSDSGEHETAICWSDLCKYGETRMTYLELYNALCENFKQDKMLIKIIKNNKELK